MQILLDVFKNFGDLICVMRDIDHDVLKPSDHILFLRILIDVINEFKLVQPKAKHRSIEITVELLEDEKKSITIETVSVWNHLAVESLKKKLSPIDIVFSENDYCMMTYYLCERLNHVKQLELKGRQKVAFAQFIAETKKHVLTLDQLNTIAVLKELKTVTSPVYDFLRLNKTFLSALLSKNAGEWWEQLPEQLKTSMRVITQAMQQVANDVDTSRDLKRRCGLFIPNEQVYELAPTPAITQADFHTALVEAFVGLDDSETERYSIITLTKIYYEKSDWLDMLSDLRDCTLPEAVKKSLSFVPVWNQDGALLTDETLEPNEEREVKNCNPAFFKTGAFYNKGYFVLHNLKLLTPDLSERISSLSEILPLVEICKRAMPNLVWHAYLSSNLCLAHGREHQAGFKIFCNRFPIILEIFNDHMTIFLQAAQNWNEFTSTEKKRQLSSTATPPGPVHKRRCSGMGIDDDNDAVSGLSL